MNFWWNRFNPLRGLYDPRASPALRDFTALAMSGSLRDQSKGYCSCFRMLMLGLELSHQCRPLLQRLDSAGLQSQDRYAAIACAGLVSQIPWKVCKAYLPASVEILSLTQASGISTSTPGTASRISNSQAWRHLPSRCASCSRLPSHPIDTPQSLCSSSKPPMCATQASACISRSACNLALAPLGLHGCECQSTQCKAAASDTGSTRTGRFADTSHF